MNDTDDRSSDTAQEHLRAAAAREYGSLYNYINWVTPGQAAAAERDRRDLLQAPGVGVSCLGTKIHHGPLSPGCRQCAARAWSCLFITGRCNGRCFYCPTPQDADDPPMSTGVAFPRPADFAAYVHRFGFGGASISGGEPFLDPARCLDYVRALRDVCGPDLHIWLYTNGILATPDTLRRLALAGLNEIRFDIGATDYNLKHLRMAQGLVPTVTVEIPAVPEEENRLRHLLNDLSAAGVSHLNLHQLRLTPHNARHLLERDYTYVHGPKVTILESELCALRLVAEAADRGLPLAVNYCSFVYKHRFQSAASRARCGVWLLDPGEELTASGFIRSLHVQEKDAHAWITATRGDRSVSGSKVRVAYATACLRGQASPSVSHRSVDLSPDFQVTVERHAVDAPRITDLASLERNMTGPAPDPDRPGLYPPSLEESREWITPGLGPYF